MSQPLPVAVAPHPLQALLEQHFSPAALEELLGAPGAALEPGLWHRAMYQALADFLERPGKALRAQLVRQAFRLAGGRGSCPELLAAVVEVLHAGSLIVDDIQDDSGTRRGGPALHRLHGVPVALNAGNWMYFWALHLLEQVDVAPDVQLALYRSVHRVLLRCHHGQALDLTSNVYELPLRHVAPVVIATTELKSGALMELAAVLGAVAAAATPERVEALARLGRDIGIGLQMLDDLSGLTSDKRRHKGHEDLLLGRPTWPWAWVCEELPEARVQALRELGAQVAAGKVSPDELAGQLRAHLRGSGRVRIRRHLQRACGRIRALAPPAALEGLERHLRNLERSYG